MLNLLTDDEALLLLMRMPETLSKSETASIKDYYDEKGKDAVLRLVTQNRLIPFAAHVLSYEDCDKKYWDQIHKNFIERNKKITLVLEDIFSDLVKKDCKSLCVTENFGSVLRSDYCLGCFCSGDVDLSADVFDIQIIEAILQDHGFIKDNRKNHKALKDQVSMYYNNKMIDGMFWLQITWVAISRSFLVQSKYEMRLKNERLLATCVNNTSIRVLNPNALMYFCALHIASGHYYTLSPGIRLYVDIDRLAYSHQIDYDKLMNWSEEDGAGIRIGMVLVISKILYHVRIPDSIYLQIFGNKVNSRLAAYLYNEKTCQIQTKDKKWNRLYIELASENTGIIKAAIILLLKMIECRIGNKK